MKKLLLGILFSGCVSSSNPGLTTQLKNALGMSCMVGGIPFSVCACIVDKYNSNYNDAKTMEIFETDTEGLVFTGHHDQCYREIYKKEPKYHEQETIKNSNEIEG